MDRLATPRNDRVAVHEVHSRLTQEQLEEETVGEELVGALLELGRLVMSGPAAAAWIRTVEEAASRTPRPDLVWSGPEVPGVHARDTRRVYEEMLGSAERSVCVSTLAKWVKQRKVKRLRPGKYQKL